MDIVVRVTEPSLELIELSSIHNKSKKILFRILGKTWNAKEKTVISGNKKVTKGRQLPSNSAPTKTTQSSVKVSLVRFSVIFIPTVKLTDLTA